MTGTIVETTAGRVEGRQLAGGVRVWRGIPFAAPPIGPRRFELPAPPAPWTGVRPAFEPAPAPLQPLAAPLGVGVPGMHPAAISEDCLYLDVWAPDPSGPGAASGAGPAAVMVWIPGGAFVIGSGALATYDGARLAAEGGVVVVTLNHRLGILGFSAFADGHPNLGLVDLAVALAWVQGNIAAFGGDPGRVTVFGESAGGGAICHLLATRLAQGMFHRAIVQSGATGFTQTLDQARRATERTAAAGDLRTMDAEALLAAQGAALVDLMAELGAMPFHPCVDHGVVKRTPLEALTAGDAAGVDLLIGTTAHEMRLYVDVRDDLAPDRLRSMLVREAGSEAGADALLAAYGATSAAGAASPAQVWSDVRTDADLTIWAERLAAAQSVHQPRTYRYVFTAEAAAEGGRLGACHAVDLPFTFGTFDVAGWGEFVGAGPVAEAVGRDLRQRWTAFARDGVPGADWPGYDTGRRATRIIGPEPGLVDDPRAAIREAWATIRP